VHPGSAAIPGLTIPGLILSAAAAGADRAAGGPLVARLGGELVIAGAPALRDELAGLLRHGPVRLVIELSGVTHCDISGLAVLVGAGHRARRAGGSLGLAALSPPVDAILHATGLHRHLEVFGTAAAALSGRDDPAADAGRDRAAPARRPFAYSQAAATRLRRVLDAGRRPALI
jgi:anti-anti-sigma factor